MLAIPRPRPVEAGVLLSVNTSVVQVFASFPPAHVLSCGASFGKGVRERQAQLPSEKYRPLAKYTLRFRKRPSQASPARLLERGELPPLPSPWEKTDFMLESAPPPRPPKPYDVRFLAISSGFAEN